MKKHDFIQELTAQLAPIDAQARAEIIADINEHFAEGLAHGQSEEEICKNLGQPGQIAEQVLEEYKAYKTKNHPDYSANTSNSPHGFKGLEGLDGLEALEDLGDIEGLEVLGNLGDIISSAMDTEGNIDIGGIVSSAMETAREATKAARKASRETARAARETARAAREAAREARNAAREAGEQGYQNPFEDTMWNPNTNTNSATRVRGGYEIDIDQSFTGITAMDIAFSIANVKLVAATQSNDTRVTIQGKSRHNTFDVENKNGTLYIRQREPFFRFEIFGFKSTLEVTVYAPANFFGPIKVTSSVGNLSTSGINGDLKLNTSAGNISIDGHNASKAHLRSSAGKISLTNCEISDINAKSSAGNVKFEGRATTNLTLSSSAGAVNVNADTLGGNTDLSSSAGSVYLKARDVHGNITASSSAGSVKICLPQDVNCRINVSKPSIGSLHNNLTGNPHSPYTLRASTSVGSISLEPLSHDGPSRQN